MITVEHGDPPRLDDVTWISFKDSDGNHLQVHMDHGSAMVLKTMIDAQNAGTVMISHW